MSPKDVYLATFSCLKNFPEDVPEETTEIFLNRLDISWNSMTDMEKDDVNRILEC